MALPTLPTTYTTRRNIYEAAMVNRRTKNSDFYSKWDNTATYFNKENVEANKKSVWESNASFQSSMDAWKVQQERETKALNLNRRRLKLTEMLRAERESFQSELSELSPRNLNLDLDGMKERSESLRSAREERRQHFADEKIIEHLRINNPDLRQMEQKQHEKYVISEWGKQEEERKKKEAEEMLLKQEFEEELLERQKEQLELERQREQARIQEEVALKHVLKNQMTELRIRDKEASKLKTQEELLMQEQWELEQLEERRKAMEKGRQKLEFGRVLLRQHAAALKRRSRQVQEELEQDLKTLAQLARQEEEDVVIQTARREKAQTEAAWMKQVVEEQIRLEKTREAELDMLYQDEAAKVWHQREAEWNNERAARGRLMNEVLEGRQDQIRSKLQTVKQQQQESIERREEILQDLELANQLTHRDEVEKDRQKTARKVEIEAQISSRVERDMAAHKRIEEELMEEKKAEDDYEHFLQEEAQRLDHRGFQAKQHGKKQAWM